VSCAVAGLALLELNRVERARLFLLALPGERAASEVEIFDARQSAAAYKYPAVGAVMAIGIVVAWFGPMRFSKSRSRTLTTPLSQGERESWWSVALLAVFGIAVVADMATTVRFFHTHGVVDELHPGVRLFGYAYGRTVGPVLAKVVQLVGVLMIACFLGRYGKWVVVAATCLYVGAALYNFFVAR
jgi:hypothetical protein